MTEHLRNSHSSSVKKHELLTLLEMSERPVDKAHVDNCPFCYGTMTTEKLLDHIAGHMEDLAIFALPHNHEDNEEVGDAKSNIATIPQSDRRSTTRTASLRSATRMASLRSATRMASLSSTSTSSYASTKRQSSNAQPEASTITREEHDMNANRSLSRQTSSAQPDASSTTQREVPNENRSSLVQNPSTRLIRSQRVPIPKSRNVIRYYICVSYFLYD
jgi:hypothetical protein